MGPSASRTRWGQLPKRTHSSRRRRGLSTGSVSRVSVNLRRGSWPAPGRGRLGKDVAAPSGPCSPPVDPALTWGTKGSLLGEWRARGRTGHLGHGPGRPGTLGPAGAWLGAGPRRGGWNIIFTGLPCRRGPSGFLQRDRFRPKWSRAGFAGEGHRPGLPVGSGWSPGGGVTASLGLGRLCAGRGPPTTRAVSGGRRARACATPSRPPPFLALVDHDNETLKAHRPDGGPATPGPRGHRAWTGRPPAFRKALGMDRGWGPPPGPRHSRSSC